MPSDDQTTFSVYIPQELQRLGKHNPMKRLERAGKKHDRSLNYMIVHAIAYYVEALERGDIEVPGR